MRLLHKLRLATIQDYLMHMVLALLCIQVGVTWFLVTSESASQTDLIHFFKEAVPLPTIILGKFNRVKELKINFDIDCESSMKGVPQWINQEIIIFGKFTGQCV